MVITKLDIFAFEYFILQLIIRPTWYKTLAARHTTRATTLIAVIFTTGWHRSTGSVLVPSPTAHAACTPVSTVTHRPF